ncbi:hypothetical protein JMN32_23080 [Fulvivirga sp. 29W222]|uniref:Uncharacterized protein n=1 Tax=Fulvivirga marina TaxID=2494733 RepID=A0A937G201_9BACT|nr:hypothetical protein [Fulvivirga marina]MBL6449212.1 hypothetical protein [Fulvivirga marina]
MATMNILFKNVWEKDLDLKERVKEFWRQLKALPENVNVDERARQLVFVAVDDARVIGVTTAQRARIPKLNDNYFYNFRTLIHPKYRIPGLVDKLAVLTRDFLETLYISGQSDCIGLITLIENERLKQERREAVFPSTKMAFIGQTKAGHHIRLYYFKGAKI